ncbi:hypothetical protein [Lactobacillus huangpiensis]|uniref:hypothetical protein n=1 Tax=Lactobacillus huangpiensis TaxID=2799571 RepID=UPI001CC33C20|nr:hypothetical protein [Lactobacillus huangpiensis]
MKVKKAIFSALRFLLFLEMIRAIKLIEGKIIPIIIPKLKFSKITENKSPQK